MPKKFAGIRALFFGALMLTCLLVSTTAAKGDPIVVSTTSINVDFIPVLTSVTFTGGTPGASFELLCLCPDTSSLGTGTIDSTGMGFLGDLASDAAGQTSFFIQIGSLSYGRFGVQVTNLSLTGQTTPPNCVPEPATMVLFATGLAGVAIKTRKKLKQSQRNH